MIKFMTHREAAERADDLRAEFDRLLSRQNFARRSRSKQWVFLRWCFDALIGGGNLDAPFEPHQVLQYKFEVEDRLRRYYQAPGGAVRLIFQLMHFRRALALHLVNEAYPRTNGYVLLVTEQVDDTSVADAHDHETREYIERVVTESIDAEWAVYKRLPEIDLSPLDPWFLRDGPAYRRIQQLAERQNERRWTLQAPQNNPSTKRLLDIELIRIVGDEAWVRTKEYWYIRWWSIRKSRYAVSYRETNTQKHILVLRQNAWHVEHNIYPPARTVAPNRSAVIIG